jgi:hypothetical protein
MVRPIWRINNVGKLRRQKLKINLHDIYLALTGVEGAGEGYKEHRCEHESVPTLPFLPLLPVPDHVR